MPLPTGTVTFLFTDIEGSTQLWERNPEEMRQALARHDVLLRDVIERQGGSVFKTTGDAFCAAFSTAPAAVAAALAAQQGLAALDGDVPLRARMALHTGMAEPRDGDYVGPPLNRVARLLAAGHGGQVLLSLPADELARDALPPAAALRDLGLHRLKDLGRPETVFQLLHPTLPADFPPLLSLDNPELPNNLPPQATSFIGRDMEIAEVKALLGGARLLTVVGTGGAGKSRLALQVAADVLERFPDGVWLVEMAPIADPALVPRTVADALAAREEPGRTITQTLTAHLHARSVLLVLDNCEHMLASVAAIAGDLLRACPGVRVLASSREPLGAAGEQTFRIPPLSLPDPRQRQTVESVSQYEAVRLFIERARLVQPAFVVTGQNAPALAQICHRLDGIPLAIELAAARVRALPVEQIMVRLDQCFRLLTGGSKTALPRQQTLRALIDWSYDLLGEKERRLLARVSVFAGGLTMEAAEAVCAGDGLDEWEILDLLTGLVDKSLAVYEEENGAGRYRLLETVRQYAAEKLAEIGEAEKIRGCHLAFFQSYAEALWTPASQGPGSAWWLGLEAEQDNLWAAWEWCREAPDMSRFALPLVGALWHFWYMKGFYSEGYQAVARALEINASIAGGDAAQDERQARVLNGAGLLAQTLGDLPAARLHYGEALALRRDLAGGPSIPVLLGNLASVEIARGEYATARRLAQERLDVGRETGDERTITSSLRLLGLIAYAEGDLETAAGWYAQCLPRIRVARLPARLRTLLYDMGQVARARGDFAEARILFTQAREAGEGSEAAQEIDIQTALGDIARAEGDHAAARMLYREALHAAGRGGMRENMAALLIRCAALAAAEGDAARAVRLFSAEEALRASTGHVIPPVDRANFYDAALAAARAGLGGAAFAAAWAAGQSLPLARDVEAALEDAAT